MYELRINFGPGYRVYFGRIEQTIVLLLCGGDKSTQSKDIELGSVVQTKLVLLEASLALNKAASKQECLAVFRFEANAVQGPKSLQPKGLRLRGLLRRPATAGLMPVKPTRIHRHE